MASWAAGLAKRSYSRKAISIVIEAQSSSAMAKVTSAARSGWTVGQWSSLLPWLKLRLRVPTGPLFCVLRGTDPADARAQQLLCASNCTTPPAARNQTTIRADQLRHAHAVEMSRESAAAACDPTPAGHADLGIRLVYLRRHPEHRNRRRGPRPTRADRSSPLTHSGPLTKRHRPPRRRPCVRSGCRHHDRPSPPGGAIPWSTKAIRPAHAFGNEGWLMPIGDRPAPRILLSGRLHKSALDAADSSPTAVADRCLQTNGFVLAMWPSGSPRRGGSLPSVPRYRYGMSAGRRRQSRTVLVVSWLGPRSERRAHAACVRVGGRGAWVYRSFTAANWVLAGRWHRWAANPSPLVGSARHRRYRCPSIVISRSCWRWCWWPLRWGRCVFFFFFFYGDSGRVAIRWLPQEPTAPGSNPRGSSDCG